LAGLKAANSVGKDTTLAGMTVEKWVEMKVEKTVLRKAAMKVVSRVCLLALKWVVGSVAETVGP
jgi:hypothetical protein